MVKVLILEDEVILRSAYETKLSEEGFELKIVPSLKSAQEALVEFVPDVAIVDLVLLKGSGYDLIEEFKKDQTLKRVPIIVVSNHDEPQDFEKTKELGVDKFLIKSNVTIEDLVLEIKTLTSSK